MTKTISPTTRRPLSLDCHSPNRAVIIRPSACHPLALCVVAPPTTTWHPSSPPSPLSWCHCQPLPHFRHLPKPHHMSRGRWRDGRGSGHGGGGLRARTSTRQLKCNDMLSARTKLLRWQTNYRESSSPADRTATTTTARDYFSQRLGHPRQFIYPGHVCARSSFSPGRLLVA